MRQTLLILGLLILPAASTVGAEPLFDSWAVLATPAVLESGLSDLVTVQLSQDASIRLVERERLRDATRELQLAALIKAESIDERLELGKTLGADALLVLSTAQRDEKNLLRVVVCDSVLGVRLWDEHFSNEDPDVERLARQCAAVVAEVRQRFGGGIRHLIAVPPFLSENFEQQFDHLQARYSERLSSACMSHAGVAVVEIEEARVILRELEDTLRGGIERPIATIVEGTYRVSPPDEENQRRVELRIGFVNGEQRENINKTFQLGTIEHWLTTSLTKRLLSTGEGGSLSADAQKAILIRHAQRFAELGAWERSTSLREAALVLDPNDALQRGLAISEYQYSIQPLLEKYWARARFAKLLPPGTRAAVLQRVAYDYVVALNHLEYLVRNKLINRVDAIGLLHTQVWARPGLVGSALPLDPLRHAALQPACRAQRRFIREFGAQLNQLPPGRLLPEQLSKSFYGVEYTLTQRVLSDVGFNNYSAASLEGLRDLLERILPADAQVSSSLLSCMRRVFTADQQMDRNEYRERQQVLKKAVVDADDDQTRRDASDELRTLTIDSVTAHFDKAREAWLSYLEQLTRSKREVVRLYGHWGLLREVDRNARSVSRLGGESLPARVAAMESQLAEVKQLGRIEKNTLQYVESNLNMTRNWLRAQAAPARAGSSRPYSPDDYFSSGRVQLEPVWLRVEGKEEDRPPLIKGMLQCGDRCDAYWTSDRFFLMHEPGVLREVKLTDAHADHLLFWNATWDGECIWIHAHGVGIVAIHTDGRRLATFQENKDIPGYWKGFQLVGLSPRRALMVGSFGEAKRGWCAILKIDEHGEPSADVFFEAKYVADGRTKEQAEADPRTAFQPQRVQHVRGADGKGYVLVTRKKLSKYLRIDPAAKEVSVGGISGASTRTDLGFRGPSFLHNGRYVHVRLADLSQDLSQSGASRFVFHDGWLYAVGHFWFRVHAETGQEERLQPRPLKMPTGYWNLRGGTSAHYGLVVHHLYNRRPPIHRVTILNEEASGKAQEAKP